jgi:TRAP-type C4-dicarboxylate transport system permease small subunit
MKSKTITNQIYPFVLLFNWIASLTIIAMMLFTCFDVIFRFFRCPIPGVYETVGLLGAIFVSFSLAYTSLTQSHIAVDFLVQKLSPGIQDIINCFHMFVATGLFGLIAWQSVWYAIELKANGEVSSTLQISIYPFVFGVAIGCFMLCLVLSAQLIDKAYALIKTIQAEKG